MEIWKARVAPPPPSISESILTGAVKSGAETLDKKAVKNFNKTLITQQTEAVKKTGDAMIADPTAMQQQRKWMEEAYLTIINTFKGSVENSNIKLEDVVKSKASTSGSDSNWLAEMIKKASGEGADESANDAIVRSDGKVIKLNSNDNVYATTRNLNFNRASTINNGSPAKPQSSTSLTKMASIQHYTTQYNNSKMNEQSQIYNELKQLVALLKEGKDKNPITVINNNSSRFNPQSIMQNLQGVEV